MTSDSASNITKVISQLIENLTQACHDNSTHPDSTNIELAISYFNSASADSRNLSSIVQVLHVAIAYVKQIEAENSLVLRLIEAILRPFDIQFIVQNFLPSQQLLEALQSWEYPDLQVIAIRQFSKRVLDDSLLDFLRELEVSIPTALLNILEKSESSLVVSETLNALSEYVLYKGHIFTVLYETDHAFTEKLKVLHDGDALQQGRLMELIQRSQFLFPLELFQFSTESIEKDDDILLVINKIQFYRDLINKYSTQIIGKITPQIDAIGLLWTRRDSFYETELELFYGTLSRKDAAYFAAQDEKYGITRDLKSPQFVSFLSPHYLADKRPEAITGMTFVTRNLNAIENCMQEKTAYDLLALNAEKIINLEYSESITVMLAMVKTSWGLRDLLSWPRVMERLLDTSEVRDSETLATKREVIERLLDIGDSAGVWKPRLKEAHQVIVYGRASTVSAAVASESAQ